MTTKNKLESCRRFDSDPSHSLFFPRSDNSKSQKPKNLSYRGWS